MVKRLVLSILLATGVAFGIGSHLAGSNNGNVGHANVQLAGDYPPNPVI